MVTYVYIIENKLTEKSYIGYTKDPTRRESYHFRGKSNCPALQAAIKKYGSENFEFVFLERCSSEIEAKEKEIYWIAQLNTISPNGYNLTLGGDGLVATDEVRKKLSESLKGNTCSKGRVLSEEHKRRIGEAQRGPKHYNYGKKLSQAHKAKLCASSPHRKLTEEHKQILRDANLGKQMPEEVKQKIRAAKIGGKLSVKHKEKISNSIKRWWSERRERVHDDEVN